MSETNLPEFPVYEISPTDLPTVIRDFPPLVTPIPTIPIAPPPETPEVPKAPEPKTPEPKPAQK